MGNLHNHHNRAVRIQERTDFVKRFRNLFRFLEVYAECDRKSRFSMDILFEMAVHKLSELRMEMAGAK